MSTAINCRLASQKPLTYLRQVTALLLDPQLLASNGAYGCYPADVVAKAREILAGFPGSSVGSYTHTGGHLPVREAIARYLTNRDGLPARLEDLLVTCGSTEAIRLLLEAFGRRKPTPAGVLVPSPGCRMYTEFAKQVGVLPTAYRLTGPERGWQLDEEELEAAYQAAIASGSEPRILVVINPGSPAGQILTETSLRLAADFAFRRSLLVVADETLQFAVHSESVGASFVPFRCVVLKSPAPLNTLELVSLTSLSRGPTSGEAGLRTGFCELMNLHPGAVSGLLAVLACTSCPPVVGQAALVATLEPPSPGQPSYDRFVAELTQAQASRRRATSLAIEFFAASPELGDLLVPPAAGNRAYARLRLPSLASRISKSNNNYDNDTPVDVAFSQALVDQLNGLSAVQPGSFFGHPPEEEHFYISIDIQSSTDEELLANLNVIKGVWFGFVENLRQEHRVGQ